MALQKRRRSYGIDGDNESDTDSDRVDISSALTGKRQKHQQVHSIFTADDGDDGLEEVIRETIAKRDVKSGTELLKSMGSSFLVS